MIAAKQEKVLVFTQFREVTAPLAAFLGGVFGRPGLVLHGETAVKKRKELVQRFQEDESVPFFVLSLKAGGTGLNLTAASHVVHFDRWWNPAVENQATDRAFRIGQTKNVLVHKFVCRGTVEEKIDELIESKKQLSPELLEGGAELQPDRDEGRGAAAARRARSQRRAEGVTHVCYGWRPYVSVAERRRKAAREMQKLRKKGHPVSPVVIEGRTIARTFWGKAWCDNLERYSDFANRLPRGRTYVRNGSVVDLQIAPGEVNALVSGSELYKVAVKVSAVPKARWTSICADCAGAIDSLVELLQGRFSKGVMERICQQKTGLFPAPAEIEFSCSCPDWASMCKHVAAVLYGIGARLDEQPELPLHACARSTRRISSPRPAAACRCRRRAPRHDKVLGRRAVCPSCSAWRWPRAKATRHRVAFRRRRRRSENVAPSRDAPPKRSRPCAGARASRSAREAAPARKRARKTEEKPGHPPKKAGAARPAKKKRNIP